MLETVWGARGGCLTGYSQTNHRTNTLMSNDVMYVMHEVLCATIHGDVVTHVMIITIVIIIIMIIINAAYLLLCMFNVMCEYGLQCIGKLRESYRCKCCVFSCTPCLCGCDGQHDGET